MVTKKLRLCASTLKMKGYRPPSPPQNYTHYEAVRIILFCCICSEYSKPGAQQNDCLSFSSLVIATKRYALCFDARVVAHNTVSSLFLTCFAGERQISNSFFLLLDSFLSRQFPAYFALCFRDAQSYSVAGCNAAQPRPQAYSSIAQFSPLHGKHCDPGREAYQQRPCSPILASGTSLTTDVFMANANSATSLQ